MWQSIPRPYHLASRSPALCQHPAAYISNATFEALSVTTSTSSSLPLWQCLGFSRSFHQESDAPTKQQPSKQVARNVVSSGGNDYIFGRRRHFGTKCLLQFQQTLVIDWVFGSREGTRTISTRFEIVLSAWRPSRFLGCPPIYYITQQFGVARYCIFGFVQGRRC